MKTLQKKKEKKMNMGPLKSHTGETDTLSDINLFKYSPKKSSNC